MLRIRCSTQVCTIASGDYGLEVIAEEIITGLYDPEPPPDDPWAVTLLDRHPAETCRCFGTVLAVAVVAALLAVVLGDLLPSGR